MAHRGEPMDVDSMDSEFDNKENSYHHSNVLPCTEKGYEELDVSELNMKLRYSATPAASPMSKSYTALVDSRITEGELATIENSNLTHSLNSTMTFNDNVIKSLKCLPLQTIATEQIEDNRTSILRQLDSTISKDDNNVTITLSTPNEHDESLSFPSTSSSARHTPEATTPTNIKNDESSPIIRGLKSVFNMFRSSQSPIPPAENENSLKHEDLTTVNQEDQRPQTLASTPMSAHRSRDSSTSKRSSPLKDSIVFNEDLEKEIQWTEETISGEKVPLHKLLQQPKPIPTVVSATLQDEQKHLGDMDVTDEYMDISCNNSVVMDTTVTETNKNAIAGESDGEFVDCETTLNINETKNQNETQTTEKVEDKCHIGVVVNINTNEERHNEEKITITEKNYNIVDKNEVGDAPLHIQEIKQAMSANGAVVIDNITMNMISDNVPTIEITNKHVFENMANEVNQLQNNLTDPNNISNEKNESIPEQRIILVAKKESDVDIKALNSLRPDFVEDSVPVESSQIALDSNKNYEYESCKEHTELHDENQNNDTFDIESNRNQANESYKEEAPLIDENKSKITLDETKSIVHNIEGLNSDIPNLVSESTNVSPFDKDIPIECAIEEIQHTTSGPNILQQSESYLKTNRLTKNVIETDNVNEIVEIIHADDVSKQEEISEIKPDDAFVPSMNDTPDEPRNTPLPDDDDDDIDINMEPHNDLSKVSSIETPPDVLDTIHTESKLNIIETIDKIFDESTQLNILEKTIAQLEQPLSESLFNETIDIVNSLNEIIGESSNSTKSDCMSDECQSVKPVVVIDCKDELHSLPDLVNQTINLTNTATESECKITMNQDLITSETINETQSIPNGSETISNISESNILKADVVDTLSTELNNTFNQTEKHAEYTTNAQIENNDAVPTAQEKRDAEIEDFLSINSTQGVDTIPKAVIMNEYGLPILDGVRLDSHNNSANVMPETEPKLIEESTKKLDITSDLIIAPSSPPIQSKGYNFNFDEMDDPFATKTKIKQSPPPQKKCVETDKNDDVITKNIVPNRRRSQPALRKRPSNKNKSNGSIDADIVTNSRYSNSDNQNFEINSNRVAVDVIKNDMVPKSVEETDSKINAEEAIDSIQTTSISEEERNELGLDKNVTNILNEQNVTLLDTENITPATSIENKSVESFAISESKTSSSEQSTYYSAAASSEDSSISRNVFNLPEIEDLNFNPFATKSKMRQSPTYDFNTENSFANQSTPDSSIAVPNGEKSEISSPSRETDTVDKMDIETMEKDTSYDIGIAKSISNTSSREVNTDDEDTEEGPFLEAEDAIDRIIALENDNADKLEFHKVPTQSNDDNGDGELFIDAEAFEFLLNQNKSNVVADSGKESLFLKFDPLFAKRISSDGVLAALSNVQKRQSTPTKPSRPSFRNEDSPIAGPSAFDATYDGEMNVTQESNEDLNITVAKPMMVVTPAVNPAVTPRNKSTTPTRPERRSITFTSPAMAFIDRLLSLSGNSSFVGHDTTTSQPSREQNEADLALTQLRELLAEKERSIYELRAESKDLKDRLSNMESQVKVLEASSQGRLQKINELNDRFAEKATINKKMAAVVEEYERTIASLIAETEHDKKRHAEERTRLINERDEQMAHLASMEVSFNDVHSKYEKSKQVILSCKANEETCMKSIKEFEENLKKMQKNYETLKQHATSKLNYANQELQKLNKAHQSEVLKLNAMIKRKDMHITSLEETLAQKTKANEELTAICDELINKVG